MRMFWIDRVYLNPHDGSTIDVRGFAIASTFGLADKALARRIAFEKPPELKGLLHAMSFGGYAPGVTEQRPLAIRRPRSRCA